MFRRGDTDGLIWGQETRVDPALGTKFGVDVTFELCLEVVTYILLPTRHQFQGSSNRKAK